MFEIFYTDEARKQLDRLKTDKRLEKRHKAVKKAISFLSLKSEAQEPSNT